MKSVTRQMKSDEIPLIEGIDRAEELRVEYHCIPLAEGLGLRLCRRLVNPPRHISKWSKVELTSRFELWNRNLEDGAVLFGSFEGQKLVVFILVTVHSEKTLGEIYSLFVNRYHRGKGLGTALLEKAEHYCRNLKATNLILYTGHSAPAVDF